jgi:hypothetical protein
MADIGRCRLVFLDYVPAVLVNNFIVDRYPLCLDKDIHVKMAFAALEARLGINGMLGSK